MTLKKATLQVNNEPTDCIKIPGRKRLEDILPLSNINEIIIYSSCIKIVSNEFKVHKIPMNVSIPEDLPKLRRVVSYDGEYKTICAYSFNDTIYVSDNDSIYLPTSNLAVYFDYFDPITDKDGYIRYRMLEVLISELDVPTGSSDSEKDSFYKCLGVIPDTSYVVNDDEEGKLFVINKTPDGEQKLVKRDFTMQITDCPTVGNYVSVNAETVGNYVSINTDNNKSNYIEW